MGASPMTGPRIFLTRMAVFLAVAVAIAAALNGPLFRAFQTNPALNGLIGAVLLVGIVYIFRQVFQLRADAAWLNHFRRAEPGLTVEAPSRLLAPMAAMLRERQGRISLSTLSSRSLLDSISARLDESRELSRYLIGLMIFLGLLGTFWGLLLTVSSVGDTIRALAPGGNDLAKAFDDLKHGLEQPLGGMGTAFSTSMFGLSGSLVLGFLDLQAGQAQNRFYSELEEWIASVTRLSSGAGPAEGDGASVPAYVQALLEQTADSLENLQRIMARTEESRTSANTALLQLAERLAVLSDQMRSEQDLLVRLAESQIEMRPLIARLAQAQDTGGLDAASRNHLRNLDVYMGRLLEETVEGRNQLVQELRSEIKLLARTVAVATEDARKG
ncbi:MAG TPA: flagellar motor protein MotA [Stellaceae bacterium]|nr:flagellar motor protein MotA [Stellaceae bacterium]